MNDFQHTRHQQMIQRAAAFLQSGRVVEEVRSRGSEVNGKPKLYFYTTDPKAEEFLTAFSLNKDHVNDTGKEVVEEKEQDGVVWRKALLKGPVAVEALKQLEETQGQSILKGSEAMQPPSWWSLQQGRKQVHQVVSTANGKHYLMNAKRDVAFVPITTFVREGMLGKQNHRGYQSFSTENSVYGLVEISADVAGLITRSPTYPHYKEMQTEFADYSALQDYFDQQDIQAWVDMRQEDIRLESLMAPTPAPTFEVDPWQAALAKYNKSYGNKLTQALIYPFRQRRGDGSFTYGVHIDHQAMCGILKDGFAAHDRQAGHETAVFHTDRNIIFKQNGEAAQRRFLVLLAESGISYGEEKIVPWNTTTSFINKLRDVKVVATEAGPALYLTTDRTREVNDIQSALGVIPPDSLTKLSTRPGAACFRLMLPEDVVKDFVMQLASVRRLRFHDLRDKGILSAEDADRMVLASGQLAMGEDNNDNGQEGITTGKGDKQSRASENILTPFAKPTVLSNDSTFLEALQSVGVNHILLASSFTPFTEHREEVGEDGRKIQIKEVRETIRYWAAIPASSPAMGIITPTLRKNATRIISLNTGGQYAIVPIDKALHHALEAHYHDVEDMPQLASLDTKRQDGAVAHDVLDERIRRKLDERASREKETIPLATQLVQHLSGKSLVRAQVRFPTAEEFAELLDQVHPDELPPLVTQYAERCMGKVTGSHMAAVAMLRGVRPEIAHHAHAPVNVRKIVGAWQNLKDGHNGLHEALTREAAWVENHTDDARCASVLMVIAPDSETIGLLNPSAPLDDVGEAREEETKKRNKVKKEIEEVQSWFSRPPISYPNGAGNGRNVLLLFLTPEGVTNISPAVAPDEHEKEVLSSPDIATYLSNRFRANDDTQKPKTRSARTVHQTKEEKDMAFCLQSVRQRLGTNKPFLVKERVIQADTTLGSPKEKTQYALVFRINGNKEQARLVGIADEMKDYIVGKAVRTRPRVSTQLAEYCRLRTEKDARERQTQDLQLLGEIRYHLRKHGFLNQQGDAYDAAFSDSNAQAVEAFNVYAMEHGLEPVPPLEPLRQRIAQYFALQHAGGQVQALHKGDIVTRDAVEKEINDYCVELEDRMRTIKEYPKEDRIAELEEQYPNLRDHYLKHYNALEGVKGDEEAYELEKPGIYRTADSTRIEGDDWGDKPVLVKLYITEPMAELMQHTLTASEIKNPRADFQLRTSKEVYEAALDWFQMKASRPGR